MEKTRTKIEQRARQSYMRDFVPAVVGYAVVLLAVVLLLVDFDTAGGWKYVVALLPVIPALWGVRAVALHVGRIDELQRRITIDAMAAGFGVAMIAALTIGFLAMSGLDSNRWAPWAIYSAGMLAWMVFAARGTRSHE